MRQGTFLIFTAQRRTLGPTQPPTQYLPQVLSKGVNRMLLESVHSVLSRVEFRNKISCRRAWRVITNELHGFQSAAAGEEVPTLGIEVIAWAAQQIHSAVNLSFLDWSRYIFFQVAPHLSSWGWVNPVPYPLLMRLSGNAGNRTRKLSLCSQELWPLYHRDGMNNCIEAQFCPTFTKLYVFPLHLPFVIS
jgi:hypothetical protein